MTYKVLLDVIKDLSPEELNQNVIFVSDEKGFNVTNILKTKFDIYIDKNYPEDGIFALDPSESTEESTLIYPLGSVFLI